MITHLLTCPSCGPFGRRKRRRDRVAADEALIRFHTHLAAQARRERARRTGELLAIRNCRPVEVVPS